MSLCGWNAGTFSSASVIVGNRGAMAGMGCGWSRFWRQRSGRWRRTGCRSRLSRQSTGRWAKACFCGARCEVSEELVALIVGVLQEQSDGRGVKIAVELGGETPLFGRDGVLDSMGMENLVDDEEQDKE